MAQDLTVEVAEDAPVELRFQASGFGSLVYAIVAAPDHGTLSEVRPDGSVTYTPNADYDGADALSFQVIDHWGQTAQGQVTLTVKPANDAPTLSAVANQRIASGGSTGELAFTVEDVDTPADRLTVTATSSNADLVPNDPSKLVLGGSGANRTLHVIPAAGVSGTTTITLAVGDGADTTSITFTVEVTAPASLYWVTATNSLWKVDLNGANAVELKTGIAGLSVVATDPLTRTVYYKRDSALVRVDSAGANPVDIVANGGFPSGLAVDATNRKLYWSDFNGKRVMRAELDGSNPTQVIGGIDSPSALAVDASRGKVYVITYNNTVLIRFNLDGTQKETLATGVGGQGVGLALDVSGGKLYFATRGSSLYVANLDGTDITPLVSNQSTVHGVAIDVAAGRVYWVDWLGEAVRSARLSDGGDIQTLKSGGGRNLGLALMPAP
ncbi:Ig-like domain-containing protein [Myxococcus stipitatus]|uniref:Ig-like domain-containing protein n=1 Tax=Myxococcus stipitatus TaxID=83455 RepID=UPI00030C93F4|nr:Ig-like domain-containing protein [Myxococcus stipitatus]